MRWTFYVLYTTVGHIALGAVDASREAAAQNLLSQICLTRAERLDLKER